MNVNKENVELFCQALESGEYEQVRGAMFGDKRTEACALGVAVRVARGEPLERFYGIDALGMRLKLQGGDVDEDSHQRLEDLRSFWCEKVGLEIEPATVLLVQANDMLKLDFWTIAQRIRETYLKDEEETKK